MRLCIKTKILFPLAMQTKQNNINIQNKRARFEYEILDKYTAGIVLKGTEIKSIRLGKASIAESFCEFSEKGPLKSMLGELITTISLRVNENFY